jgi:hypothetical protein
MNGRIYDYNLGRFMSVDPFIQMPESSQSINPYSYLMNNPMAGTDPTGYIAQGTNASNWRDNCFDAHGCLSTPVDRALSTYTSSGGNNNSLSLNAQKALDEMNKGFANTFGQVNIIDLPAGGGTNVSGGGFLDSLSLADGASMVIPGWDVGACVINGCSGSDWAWAAAGILPIGKAAKAYKMYDKFDGGTTTLYRAVGPDEFYSLQKNGGAFQFGPNGSTMKQFGFNADEVLKYANWNPDYGAIMKIRVDSKALSNFDVSFGQIDPSIFRSGVVTVQGQGQLKKLNSSVKSIEQEL